MEMHPSIITGHVVKENHTIDWEGEVYGYTDTDWTARGVKEAVEIRKIGAHAMNWDRAPPTSIIVLQVADEEDVTVCHKQ